MFELRKIGRLIIQKWNPAIKINEIATVNDRAIDCDSL